MNIIFSERLNEIMEERDITPKQLAQATGISLPSIYSWRKGKFFIIYLAKLIKLCNALQCSLEFLTGRSESILDYNPKECPPFYGRLRAFMEKKGVTRYRLVKETRICDNYFTVWKNGREPQLYILIKLADYFDCTIDCLVGRES